MKQSKRKGRTLLLLGTLLGILALPAEATEVKTASTYDEFSRELAQLVKEYPTEHAQSIAAQNPFVLKRLIVQAKSGTLDFSKLKAVEAVQSPDHTYIVQFASAADAKYAMEEIQKWSGIEYVEPDSYVRISETWKDTSGLELIGTAGAEGWVSDFSAQSVIQSNSWGVAKIGAAEYAKTVAENTTKSITVAVVDTGTAAHSFLKSRLVSGYDYVDNDSDPNDLNGHGTHVAGTVVDCTPGLNVKIMPVRVLDAEGTGYSSVVGAGIRYAADHGAKIINLSLSGNCSHYKEDAIDYAIGKGVTVVAASGNDAAYIDYAETCPAHLENVICVGAVNSANSLAYFSNYGSTLDLVAPGVGIKSCVPGGGYEYWDGTSMAAPHVSAAAAMVKLLNPSYTPAKIERALKNSCTDLGEAGWDMGYGYGILNCTKLPSSIAATGVTLNKTSVTVTKGTKYTLKATVSPSNATDKTVTWSSANPKVATVSSSGIVTTKQSGIATITAKTSNGKTASCKVKVTEPATVNLPAPTVHKAEAAANGTITVGWTRVSGANGYRVTYYNYGTNTSINEYLSTSANTNWSKKLNQNMVYRISVTPYKVVNSKRVFGSTRSVYLAASRTIKGTTAGSSAVTLSWTQLKGCAGYRVYTSKTQNSGYKLVKTLAASSVKTQLTGLGSSPVYMKLIPYKLVGQAKVNLPYTIVKIK